MKKGTLLNSEIIAVISKMGHTDSIVIGDAGLPVPDGVRRIDLAVTQGNPSFLEVLDALLTEFECEAYTLASEISDRNPEIERAVIERLPESTLTYVDHETFKKECSDAKAVVRTGEFSPYANVILKSGVLF